MRILSLVLICCALAAMSACGRPAEPETRVPQVVVSIRPLQLLVQDLAGPAVQVINLMPAGTDPHHFSLTAEARQAVAEADAVIWMGPELERPLARLLANDARAHSLAPPGQDVHVWLDPIHAAGMIDRIAAALAPLLPAPSLMAADAATLKIQLDIFRTITAETLAPARERTYGVEHPAFDRFASSVGLPPALAVNPNAGADLSAGRLAELQTTLADGACFMAETPNRDAMRLAELFNLPLVVVDPLARDPEIESYINFLERVRVGFYQCFGIRLS